MRTTLLALATAMAIAICPIGRALDAADGDAPETALQAMVKALRADDLKGLLSALPAADQSKAAEQWKQAQADTDARSSAQFDQLMAMLLAPDAVDQLMAKAEPQLRKADPAGWSQNLMSLGMILPMMLQSGPDGRPRPMTPELQHGITQIQNLIADVAAWLPSSGLNDAKKLHAALEHLVAGAKALGVADTKQLHALAFDVLLGRMGGLLKETKTALAVYDLQLDKLLDSVTATSSGEGDQRTLSVGFTAFGRAYETPVKVEKRDGRWVMAKDAAPAGFDAVGGMLKGMFGGGGGQGAPADQPTR